VCRFLGAFSQEDLFGWFRFEAMRNDGIVCWNIEAVVVEALTVTAVCAAVLRIRSLEVQRFRKTETHEMAWSRSKRQSGCTFLRRDFCCSRFPRSILPALLTRAVMGPDAGCAKRIGIVGK
jgi:hypothetical protein